ncbi:AraC family transcriptional regulator [Hoeflea marina]|uniref:AraC family transcriptional regulator n=1 Tax=Hoeflea marina TaxID=274592 RepID=A0A317PEC0_9HYPH|nr:helix-turn-helix transcriptional regulator [Hoeflea marina]PWV95161.1 AraC family transcriptional regulator [Hoeflea marina]
MIRSVYVFDTNGIPVRDQFNAFRSELSLLGLSGPEQTGDGRRGFSARLDGHDIGELKIVHSVTDGYTFSMPEYRARDVGLDYWLIMLRVRGCAEVEINGDRVRFEGNLIEVRDLKRARSGQVSKNRSMAVYVPRHKLEGMESVLNQLAAMDSSACLHPLLSHYLASMAGMLPDLDVNEYSVIADTTLSMIRACVSLSRDAIAAAQEVIMATRLEMAKRIVNSNLKSPYLSAESLGAELNVSRRQLYKIFDGVGGVDRYLRSCRLEACHKAILEKGGAQPINALAEEYGFPDAATFSRQFRAEFGCSPSEVRERACCSVAKSGFAAWLVGGQASAGPVIPPFKEHEWGRGPTRSRTRWDHHGTA